MKIEIINTMAKKFFLGIAAILVFTLINGATPSKVCADVTVPNEFQSGQIISSSEINANFQALKDALEAAIPVGTIVPFAGPSTQIPAGWALCDGTSLERDGVYNTLFLVIDTAWGAEDSTHFNLPDLRGIFLRGVDAGAGKDPNAAARTPIKPGTYYEGNTGDTVGSYQSDEFKFHDHIYQDVYHSAANGSAMTPQFDAHNESAYGYNHQRITSLRGGSETRSKNAYVNYIIKY